MEFPANEVTGATLESVGNSTRLGKAMEALGIPRPERVDAHHVIPCEVLRDHPLAKAAINAGYEVDGANNGIFLPDSKESKEGTASLKDLPIHTGGHRKYNETAKAEGNSIMDRLIERYGSLGEVPPDVLQGAMREWGKRMELHLRNPANWKANGVLA